MSSFDHISNASFGKITSLFLSVFRLVIVCGNDSPVESLMVSKLRQYRRQYTEPLKPISEFQKYLKNHFISWPGRVVEEKFRTPLVASCVDSEK